MRGTRYSEKQIVRILGDVESGWLTAETARHYGISEGTIRRWRYRFGGMGLSEVRLLRELQAENVWLRRAQGDGRRRTERAAVGKMASPERRRAAVCHLVGEDLSLQRRACGLVEVAWSSHTLLSNSVTGAGPLSLQLVLTAAW